MSDFQAAVVLMMVGFFALGLALLAKKGGVKPMFMVGFNPERPVDIIYGAIPIGISSILLSLAVLTRGTPISQLLTWVSIIGGIIFCFILMAWKPGWLKPDWLLWLEDRYGEPMLEFMFDQARKEGRSWGQRVATQEGLESWAEEMEQKYRYYIGDRDR